MRRVTFVVPDEEVDAVLDGVMPLLPRGARAEPAPPARTRFEAVGPTGSLPAREVLERAAGRPLEDWSEGDTPADWRDRRPHAPRAIGGRVVLRGPADPAAPPGLVDVVLDWSGVGFGSGSHPTTRMCVELLLGVPPAGGLADVGCGLGTLAIAAAKLGFAPVAGVDHDERAVEQARANAALNGVDVEFTTADVTAGALPYRAVMAVNAPPPVHAAVVERIPEATTTVIASGIAAAEAGPVLAAYAAAGLHCAERLDDEDRLWTAVRLEREAAGP